MRRLRWAVLIALVLGVGLVVVRATRGPEITPGSVLVLEISGGYVEAPSAPWAARLLGRAHQSFVALLSELRKAERDERLAAVVLVLRDLDLGWAKAQELREAIRALSEAGRRPIAYLEVESFESNLQAYVASAADEVYAAPGSRLSVVGLAGQFLFLGGLWEKLGVEVEVERVGQYKSAAETLAGREMSKAHREMADSLLDSVSAQFVRGLAEARDLDEETVRALVARAPTAPEELAAAGLLDGVRSLPEIFAELGRPPRVEAETYAGVDPVSVGFDPEATFALVHAAGPVVTGEASRSRSGRPLVASGALTEALEKAAEDPSIDAIVLRIDSPGGSALASDLIWEAVRRAREKKPVIASLSDLAASGGYYVACAADEIVADGGTLTGSIGVFVLRPVLGGLLEKLGVGYEGITRGPRAEILLSARALSEDTRRWLREDVHGVYDRFVARVAEGRRLDPEAVDALGRGRVWTGEQAVERGLVDALGGLREAVEIARGKLGLEPGADVALLPYPPPKPFLVELREALHGAVAGLGTALRPWPAELDALTAWLESLPARSPLLVPPVLPVIR